MWTKLSCFTEGGKQALDLIPWLQGIELQSSSDQCGRKCLHPLYGCLVMSPSCKPLPSMPGSPGWPHGVGHGLFNPFPGQIDGQMDSCSPAAAELLRAPSLLGWLAQLPERLQKAGVQRRVVHGGGWGVGTAMVLLTPHSKTLHGVMRLLSGLPALLAPKCDQKVWSLAGKWVVPNTYSQGCSQWLLPVPSSWRHPSHGCMGLLVPQPSITWGFGFGSFF